MLGLPMVCYKPFTPDAPSARALIEAAERSGVPLAVYQNRRWSGFYSAFARAVRGEGPLPVDPRDAAAALEVLDAARLSAARGEVVRLST